jgi:5'-methylthioadenosine phosphorylase
MCYALIALVSDYDCWREHEAVEDKQTLLQEIIRNLQAATENCLKVVEAALAGDGGLVSEQCACRKSLDLAVWTETSRIEPQDKERLNVLFE